MHTLIVAIHAIVIFHRSSGNSCHKLRPSTGSFQTSSRGPSPVLQLPLDRVHERRSFTCLQGFELACRHASKHLAFELSSLQRCIGSAPHRRGWRVSSRRDDKRGPREAKRPKLKASGAVLPASQDGALGPPRAIRRLFHPHPHAPDAPSQQQQPGALAVFQQPGAWQEPFEVGTAIRGTQHTTSLACGCQGWPKPRRLRRRPDALLSRRLVPGATRADGVGEGC